MLPPRFLAIGVLCASLCAHSLAEEAKKPAKPAVQPVKLEAYYREIDARPELTVTLVNLGTKPINVLDQFVALQVSIEMLDAEGEELMESVDEGFTDDLPQKDSDEPVPYGVVRLLPGYGLTQKIDLLAGIPWIGIGHGTMAGTMRHVPAIAQDRYVLPAEAVANVRTIRVILKTDGMRTWGLFTADYIASQAFGIDTKKTGSIYPGPRGEQELLIALDATTDRSVPRFGARVVKPEPEREDRPIILTPPPGPIMPPSLAPTRGSE